MLTQDSVQFPSDSCLILVWLLFGSCSISIQSPSDSCFNFRPILVWFPPTFQVNPCLTPIWFPFTLHSVPVQFQFHPLQFSSNPLFFSAIPPQNTRSPPFRSTYPFLYLLKIPPLYIIIMCPLGPPFSLLFKVCFKTYLSLSPLHINLYFYLKNFLIYLPCIGKSRTFAPAFQERESRLKLTCCKCVLIALTNNKNNLLFLWSLILKFVIFAVRFAIKGVYSGAFPFR